VQGAVSDAWVKGDGAIAQNASSLREHLNRRVAPPAGGIDPKILDRASDTIRSIWDMSRGSFNGAPKFPNPVVQDVLWRAWKRTGEESYRDAVLTTLTYLSQGGNYDHVGGRFARYSVDAQWLVPHFEKMLYDNSQLLSLLSFAWHETKQPLFRVRIDETVDWLLREMRMPAGGFASSLDADTEHEEGLTYIWPWEELRDVLGAELHPLSMIYGASPGGNFESSNILNRLAPDAIAWLGDEKEAELRDLRLKLLSRRNDGPQPDRDDKVLADWNGLAISGLAHAARVSVNGAARQAALDAFNFVSTTMADGDRVAHSSLESTLVYPGVATDYANMIRASLALFALEGEGGYLDRAEAWFAAVKKHHFVEEAAAYNLVADDAPALIATPLSLADEATPAATGTMANNAATLFMLTGDSSYRDHAEKILRHLATEGGRDIIGAASLQSAFDTLVRGRLAFVVGEGSDANALLDAALSEADPAMLSAKVKSEATRPGHPAEGKKPTRGEAALFLCDAMRCLPEIASAEAAKSALAETREGFG
jgi:uncharacterized protein YyaL (SSP411 family)